MCFSRTEHTAPCACSHEPAHPHADGGEHADGHTSCCAHEHAVPAPFVPSDADTASDTRAVYRIVNMDCPAEEALIRKRLHGMSGIVGLEFNLIRRVLTVTHTLPSTEPLEAALASIDMRAEPLGTGRTNGSPGASQIPWGRMAVAGVFALASELCELLGASHGNPLGPARTVGGITFMDALPAGLALIAIGIGGLTTYRKGWIALKHRNLNINALMSVAVTGAVLIGQYPEAAMVMVLFNLAEAIEAKALDRARNAIRNLLDLAPARAVVQSGGDWVERDVREVPAGSVVRVKPGERVALDGVIVRGQSAVNQAPITGESMPVEKDAGDTVYAGSINESGSFEFRVTADAGDSMLARIIKRVEEAQGSRAPMQSLVDRFAALYTPAVFLFASAVAVLPPLFTAGPWSEWIYTALVLLVIGCPCALVISTPVSIVSALATAARHGILIKGGLFLEQGRKLRCLALDKTGTLTHGTPRQTDFMDMQSAAGADTRALAAGLAVRSDHPLSRAITADATEHGILPAEVADFTALPGRGVSGMIDGARWYLGNRRLVEELNVCSPRLEEHIGALERQGKSVTALIGDAGVQGLFAAADTLRQSGIDAVRELKRLGIRTIMLTGDNEHVARVIAEQAGVDEFKAKLLPEDKLTVVEQLAPTGMTGMVGDGINDAPALARADIGFAMAAAGTDTAVETADVALMDDDLGKIPRFIRLSQAVHAILMQNILVAIGVKAVFFVLAFTGQAGMWSAVFADVGACLLVVANGLRVIRK